MSCVLWVRGDFDPVLFLADSPWEADSIWEPGATRWKELPAEDAGFSVLVSYAGFDEFDAQVREANAFLRESVSEFRRLAGYAGIAQMELSFGVAQRERAAWSVNLPSELISLAAAAGVAIKITLYAVATSNSANA